MSKFEKKLRKFLDNPGSLKFAEIETLLLNSGFKITEAKGSHKKFKHPESKGLSIPVHNNDCKLIYKNHVAKTLKTLRNLK